MEDLVEQAQSVNAALKDAVPTIGKPEPTYVELIRGVMDSTAGTWQTVAEVRELTGDDEEFLASLENDKNMTYARYMNSLVARATIRIGSIEVLNSPVVIQELITGDRDLLFLGIIRATYGPERTFPRTCSACGKQNDVTISLTEDFPVAKPDIDVHSTIPVTLKNGEVVDVRIPTGSDTLYVAKNNGNTAEQTTLLISRCVVWNDGKGPKDTIRWAKSLSIADRTAISKAILGIEIGPRMREVKTQCAHCQEDMVIAIDWVSLLLG